MRRFSGQECCQRASPGDKHTVCLPAPSVVQVLRAAYRLMFARFGHQHWWPGETPFEVCVGAILTQNTSWTNVERALAGLKAASLLEPERLLALPENQLARWLHPAGYYNIKARRLRSFLQVLVRDFGGDLSRLLGGETAAARARLLAIHGIGPETADSMLLYAGRQLTFVVDAYTRRIFERHSWWAPARPVAARGCPPASRRDYESLKALCEAALRHKSPGQRLDYWQDYHAQLVMVGKHFCARLRPHCAECPLAPLLPDWVSARSKPSCGAS